MAAGGKGGYRFSVKGLPKHALVARWPAKNAGTPSARWLPRVSGPEALRKVDIYHRPENPARSPQPAIHTHDPAIKRRHVAAYKAYVAQHQALRAELRLHLAAMGVELPGGLAPTGWVPIDPATVVAPPAIALPDTSAAAD